MNKTYKEMALEAEALKDSGREMEGLIPVRVRISKEPRAVFSLRLSRGELARISQAAENKGINVSEFVRLAALAATSGEVDVSAAAREAAFEQALVEFQKALSERNRKQKKSVVSRAGAALAGRDVTNRS